jgi:hypothetical protein
MKILGPATVFGPIILIILTILMGLVFASPPTSSSAISMTVNEAILVFIFVVIGAALFAAGGVFLIAVMRRTDSSYCGNAATRVCRKDGGVRR